MPLTDHTVPVHYRLELAREIGSHLPEDEITALLDSLSLTPPAGTEDDWWVIMNEIMEQMRKNGTSPDRYASSLTALIKDTGSQEVVKDYAIQHLSQWIAPVNPETSPGEADPAKVSAALEAIATAIADPALSQSTIPGTAIMAMVDASSRLDPDRTAPVWDGLEEYFTNVIDGSNPVGAPLRTSVIQAVAIRNLPQHLPAIRALAQAEQTDSGVRLSSIAALGYFASPEDRDFLKTLSTGTSAFRYAATAALQRSANQ